MADKPEATTEAGGEATEATAAAADATNDNTAVLAEERGGICGVKAGMTQVFTEAGDALAVTVIALPENTVTQVKTKEKDGYQAVQIGMLDRKKPRNKAEAGHAKKVKKQGFYNVQEFRFSDSAKLDGIQAGQVLSPEFIKEGDIIDVTSTSKGKGFQGAMKRWNFRGGRKTHGASLVHRSAGSICNDTGTGLVRKGKKMAGHMGHAKVTVQNLKVVRVDTENNVILVNGSVPGPKTGIVTVRRAAKVVNAAK